MNILFLCHKMPYPPTDGGAIATLNMIKGFAGPENRVTVLAMQTQKHNFPVDKLPAELTNLIQWNGVNVNTAINPFNLFKNLLFSSRPYNAERFNSTEFGQKLTNILHSERYDVVQLEGLYLYHYISIIRKTDTAKISLRAHNVEHEIWHRLAINEPNQLKRWYKRNLASRVKKVEFETLKSIDFLVPITSRDAEVLALENKERVKVSPTGLPDNQFEKGEAKNKNSLFYIGALDWIPNQEALIWFVDRVWRKLNDEFPDWEFCIAGRNASKTLVQFFEKSKVNYVGEVESAVQFIDNHNIMVVPLLSGSGMRIKIIEGMARGKCIVTTKIGAEGIDAKNGESIFIADTPDEFQSVLSMLMQNTNLIADCGEKAFTFARTNYNNKNLIDDLSQFYKKQLNLLP